MNTKNYNCFFPIHLDSGNRGCEAIARGTIRILDLKKEDYIGISRLIENDVKTMLDKEISYIAINHNIFQKIIHRISLLNRSEEQEKQIEYRYKYGKILASLGNKTITLITGGDMMCYGNNEVNYIANVLSQNEKKVVLWGCSIGKENITPEKIVALKKFNIITARESLTHDFLINDLKLNNVHLFPDPAFVLEAEPFNLPNYFNNECIGINLSNFVTANVNLDTMFGKNIMNLIEYILKHTDFHIVFLPHVFWPEQDDRVICNRYYSYFNKNHRIHILNTEDLNYCQIRYAISKCRFFLGARTHAMISAYAMCVPSLALGYSIKAKGIGKDLEMPDYSILDYRLLNREDEIADRFKQIMQNEDELRFTLAKEMPNYVAKAYDAKYCIEGLNDYDSN